MIISASRRCDLPAFGLPAFLAALRRGSIEVPNPYDARRPRLVSLEPAQVDCLVFWTRDPRPLEAGFGALGAFGERCLVQVTLTGYPASLEPGVLGTGEAIEAFRSLSARLGPERLVWRYDPLLLTRNLDPAFHLANFDRLSRALEGTAGRVVLSLIDEYRWTRPRLERAGEEDPVFGSPRDPGPERAGGPPPEPWPELLASLAALARARGFRPQACAEPFELGQFGIEAGACIDGAELGRLFGFEPPPRKDGGPRPHCSCSPSVDVGSYGQCPAGCVYCYARR